MTKTKFYLLLSIFLLTAFGIVTFLVKSGSFLGIDRYIDRNLPLHTNSLSFYVSTFIAYLFFPLLFALAALFWKFRKQKFESIMLLASFSGWIVAEVILKPVIHIKCPPTYYTNILADKGIFSFTFFQKIGLWETCFPSGHVTAYVVFFGYLTYLSLKYLKKSWLRSALVTVFIAVIIAVGPSRLYLHVHWFSDVLAAYLLGFTILILLILAHAYYNNLRKR